MADALDRRRCEQTRKVCYDGPRDARKAHLHAHYRIRIYRCPDCRRFHVTNDEKRPKES